jgi:hypothetical protein
VAAVGAQARTHFEQAIRQVLVAVVAFTTRQPFRSPQNLWYLSRLEPVEQQASQQMFELTHEVIQVLQLPLMHSLPEAAEQADIMIQQIKMDLLELPAVLVAVLQIIMRRTPKAIPDYRAAQL